MYFRVYRNPSLWLFIFKFKLLHLTFKIINKWVTIEQVLVIVKLIRWLLIDLVIRNESSSYLVQFRSGSKLIIYS